MTESNDKPFLPFWATPQYGGGLMQGIGIGFVSLCLLHQVAPTFYVEKNALIGGMGFVLLILGGLKARKVESDD